MFKHYFETEVHLGFDISRLPDLKWTPAEVTQVFKNNMHRPIEGLQKLESRNTLCNIHNKKEADEVKEAKD